MLLISGNEQLLGHRTGATDVRRSLINIDTQSTSFVSAMAAVFFLPFLLESLRRPGHVVTISLEIVISG